MNEKCDIPELIHVCSYVENDGLKTGFIAT